MNELDVARWWSRGGIAPPPGSVVRVAGSDPVLASRHHVGEAAASALALVGAWAGRLLELRGGPRQDVGVDVSHAAASLIGFLFQRAERMDLSRTHHPATGLFRSGDGRWVHLHGGFPHLGEGIVELLRCEPSTESVATATEGWDATDLESAAAARGLCAAVVRDAAEWDAHPQGRAVTGLPVVTVRRVADAPPRSLRRSERPLAGVRVLDLTRVLAGPTCGRTLASLGAEVLRVGSPRLPSIEPFVVDTGHGKRSAFLDLDVAEEREQFLSLAGSADVVCQSYRSGSLARRGLGPDDLAAVNPGLVYVSVNCYGHVGPWSARGGWEQLAQSVSGLAAAEGAPGSPRLVPAAATDYTTGYLTAAGTLIALARRCEEGGSWSVETSLCQTARWILGAGDDCDPAAAAGIGEPSVESRTTAWGELDYLAPAKLLDETPARWDRPPVPLGSDAPAWLR